MRDHNDNVVIVCSIENIDPMGVHTGDSVTVAPQQTLTDRLYQQLRDQAIAVIRAVGVETGGSNVQFAVNPETEEILVIEMNPRVSRSSRAGLEGHRLPDREDRRPPRRRLRARGDRQRHHAADARERSSRRSTTSSSSGRGSPSRSSPAPTRELSTHMKSVGEAMAIGRTFKQAFAKAMRSRELDATPDARRPDRGAARARSSARARTATTSCSRRSAAGRRSTRSARRTQHRPVVPARAAPSWRRDPEAPFARRAVLQGGRHLRRRVRGARRRTSTRAGSAARAHEVDRGDRPSVVILGSGPNRIGQGIEFDYCCVHAAMTVRESGRDAVMVNCNPETVSTDYDTSDRLYFEPLTLEDVLGVVEVEQPEGVIVQFGGQTPLKLAAGPAATPACRCSAPASTRSTSPRTAGASARCSTGSATRRRPTRPRTPSRRRSQRARGGRLPAARPPVLRARRPRDGDRLLAPTACADYLRARRGRGGREIFLDRFLENAIEVDVDALCDGEDVWIGGIMQHVEEAGMHSGDRACVLPPHSLGARDARPRSARPTEGIALGARRRRADQRPVRGRRRRLYVIEANPRASRTVPFVSKAIGVPLAKMACRLMLGERLARPRPARRPDAPAATCRSRRRCCRSTASRAPTRCSARRCARPARSWASRATSRPRSRRRRPRPARALPQRGHRRSSPSPTATSRRPRRSPPALHDLGFAIVATRGTARRSARMGVPVRAHQQDRRGLAARGRLDRGGEVDLVINTPTGSGARTDGWEIRRAAVARGIPCITTLSRGLAAARAIARGARGRGAGGRCRCRRSTGRRPRRRPPRLESRY